MLLGGTTLKISERALVIVRTGRKRKSTVRRDAKGKSRGEPEVVHPETLAVRKRDLRADGILLHKPEDLRDELAGSSLGRLLLRNRQDEGDPGSINQAQFDAGQAWCKIVHRHASIMGYQLSIKSSGAVMVAGGKSLAIEPDEEVVLRIRRQFRDCYNGLMAACRAHGIRVRDVTYGIAVENWPLHRLSQADYGLLRTGLNRLVMVLR